MRPFLCYPLLLVIAWTTAAYGESANVEVIRRPQLFMLGEINQQVTATYTYAGHKINNQDSSSSTLGEGYSIGTEAAILDPEFVYLKMVGGVTYQQQFNDRTTSLLDWQYNILAQCFELSYHPLTIASSRTSAMISDGFRPTYTFTRDAVSLNGSLLNSFLPLTYFYSHSNFATSGLSVDSTSTADAIGFTLHHEIPKLGSTLVTGSYQSDRSSLSENSTSYSLDLNNELFLGKDRDYQLNSKLAVYNSKSQALPQLQMSASEGLSVRISPALTGAISGEYSYDSTVDFNNNDQVSTSKSLGAQLSHKLYQSIITNLTGTYIRVDATNGNQVSYSGQANIAYTKLLPAQSDLNVNAGWGHSVSDQDFSIPDITQIDEPHLAPVTLGTITLGIVGQIVEVRSVRSFDPISNTYTNYGPSDYLVDTVRNVIQNLTIPKDTNLLISYIVRVNNKLRYTTDNFATNARLGLLGSRYTFGLSYSQTDQSALTGAANNQALTNSRSFSATADARYGKSNVGVLYTILDSNTEHSWSAGGHWDYTNTITGYDTILFGMRDLYTDYSMVQGNPGYQENSFSADASYSRHLLDWLRGNLTAGVSSGWREGRTSEVYSLRAGLDGFFRQLTFRFSGQTSYRQSSGASQRDTSIVISLLRGF